MINVYDELFLIDQRNLEGTLEFELSRDLKKLIEEFLRINYKTTLCKCGCDYNEEYSRVIVENRKNYLDEILGGTGNGAREKKFLQFVKKRGK